MTARRAAFALIALALAIRLLSVVPGADFALRGDSIDYNRYGNSIAHGPGYPNGVFDHKPGADRPPLYPYFLGAAYSLPHGGRQAALVVQALLGTLTVALIGLIALRIWGRGAGIAALALAAVYPPLVSLGSVLLTETLFVLFEVAAVAAMVEYRRGPPRLWLVLAAGACIGLAALTRGNGWILLVPLAIAAYDRRRGDIGRALVPIALLVVATVLVVAPWTLRNAVVVHRFIPVSTEAGYNLAGTYNRFTERLGGGWVPPNVNPVFRDRFSGRGVDQTTLDHELQSSALAYAREHPGFVLETLGTNLLRMVHLRGSWTEAAYELPRLHGLNVAAFWVVAALAFLGALTGGLRRTPLWLWLTPVLMLLATALVLGLVRLRAPADPFLILLAAPAAALSARRLRGARSDAADRA